MTNHLHQEQVSELSPQQRQTDEIFMRRCLQLARNGRQNAKPNPMVGAVIVSVDGKIIGEGYHVRCGEAHAEVNAFASVSAENEHLLGESTLYVSLEPCSHWGRTPPCADLIVRKGVRRVVCGSIDPFAEVQGRGVRRIREAGIEVTVGVLERECVELNERFMTFNTRRRPYIILKWAQTGNAKMDDRGKAFSISTPFTWQLVHKLRAENDAILIGHGTLRADNPKLNTREWSGSNPERMVLCRDTADVPDGFLRFDNIDAALAHLVETNKQSLLVEGGAKTLQGFIDRDLWDEISVETAPCDVSDGTTAPSIPTNARLVETLHYDGNIIRHYVREEVCGSEDSTTIK